MSLHQKVLHAKFSNQDVCILYVIYYIIFVFRQFIVACKINYLEKQNTSHPRLFRGLPPVGPLGSLPLSPPLPRPCVCVCVCVCVVTAPEDSPQNVSITHITSSNIALTWEPPSIITGRFSYVVYLSGPTGLRSEEHTSELQSQR